MIYRLNAVSTLFDGHDGEGLGVDSGGSCIEEGRSRPVLPHDRNLLTSVVVVSRYIDGPV